MSRRLLLFALVALAGCQSRDADLLGIAGQRAGKRLGLTRGQATGALSGPLRGALADSTLRARVECRLRWEKALSDQPIEVDANPAGAIRLRGTVATTALSQRAAEIAQATLGVEKVVNELTTPKAEKPAEQPAPDDAP